MKSLYSINMVWKIDNQEKPIKHSTNFYFVKNTWEQSGNNKSEWISYFLDARKEKIIFQSSPFKDVFFGYLLQWRIFVHDFHSIVTKMSFEKFIHKLLFHHKFVNILAQKAYKTLVELFYRSSTFHVCIFTNN